MSNSRDPHIDTTTRSVDPIAAGLPTQSMSGSVGDVDGPRLGDQIGHYALQEEVGRGGMGVVYRARDTTLEREIALKVLCTGQSLSRERFVREGKVTAQLQHPAIIPVHSIGETAAGLSYYTMRLVRGATLEEIIEAHAVSDETWTLFRLLEIFVTVCRAVAYAHEREVIHRDLKPSNVMVDDWGSVYVLDWGLAKILGEADGHEAPIAIVEGNQGQNSGVAGTLPFMAPEQVSRPGAVGPATDVFGLGGILYTLLTGQPPRRGTPEALLRSVRAGVEPVPPRTVKPSVPAPLSALCAVALSSDPVRRQNSAAALADQVQAYLEGRSVQPVEGPDSEFLRTYSASQFRRPSVTVDVVLVCQGDPPTVFLRQRSSPPFQGAWACPGTFVRMEEGLEETARRVLSEVVGLTTQPALEQLGSFGELDRDPRTRVITTGYLARVSARVETKTGAWFELRELDGRVILTGRGPGAPRLAFDHAQILLAALRLVAE